MSGESQLRRFVVDRVHKVVSITKIVRGRRAMVARRVEFQLIQVINKMGKISLFHGHNKFVKIYNDDILVTVQVSIHAIVYYKGIMQPVWPPVHQGNCINFSHIDISLLSIMTEYLQDGPRVGHGLGLPMGWVGLGWVGFGSEF